MRVTNQPSERVTGDTPSTERRIQEYLDTIGVRMPASSFVRHVSNVYHRHEAALYDDAHDEIQETAASWSACLDHVARSLPRRVAVLDIGAGTGFASERILDCLGDRVDQLTCSDLSHDILRRCRARLVTLSPRARYAVGSVECLSGGAERFDLIATNSVLHHLIDFRSFFDAVRRLLRPGGVYIAGHEPSSGLR